MRCLPFSLSCFLFFWSCAPDYHLHTIPLDSGCASKIAPLPMTSSWYHASVDVTGNHWSGLVLIKSMPDSSHRVVFTNEAGLTFFDFGFSKDGKLKIYFMIKKLNKKLVVQTLGKDFELILGEPFRKGPLQSWDTGQEVYFGVKQKKETAYFITSKDCASLQRLEWGDARKRRVSVKISGPGYPSPEKIELTHHTFALRIALTRIGQE
jgi:hypothetical protein